MKFTQGRWRDKPDVKRLGPAKIVRTRRVEHGFEVSLFNDDIEDRVDTLNGSVFTFTFSSPMTDVIRVQTQHHRGVRPQVPSFDLDLSAPAEISIQEEEAFTAVISGGISIRFSEKEPWKFDVLYLGQRITGTEPDSYGLFTAGTVKYTSEYLCTGVGENIYGLGERFGTVEKSGQSVQMWNEDPGTLSDLSYKNVPFYLSSNNYGVFINNPGKVEFEAGTERVNAVQFSAEGESLDYFIFAGSSPLEVIEKYTALTGRPALPPAWSFGLWLTTSFTTDYDEKSVTANIDGMESRDIPLHVFHFDCFWMKGLQWCDFTWDEEMFPDPEGMLNRLKKKGVKICVWINPYISEMSELFDEGMKKGFFLKNSSGDVYQVDEWMPGNAFVDFTNPEAARWYAGKLKNLLDIGVDCFKTDFGERIPEDAVYSNGADPVRMHNFYTYLYNRTVFELLERERGKGEAVLFARSATAGSQKFPVHWGGDCEATFESMAETLRGGLSLGMSGFGFWSHDISGFESTATPALYKRWSAFGLLSSHSRLHGASSPRVPWQFDQESVDVLRFFTKLKCRLMPYLWQHSIESSRSGVPLLRSMFLEFPDDRTCRHLDTQYMLGPSLLVAPVFSEKGEVEFYLPPGIWTDWFTGEVREGPVWIEEEPGFMRIPLWIRQNSIIPLGSVDARPDYDYAEEVTLTAGVLEGGFQQKIILTGSDLKPLCSFDVEKAANRLSVQTDMKNPEFSVHLLSESETEEIKGAFLQNTDVPGILLNAGVAEVKIVFPEKK